jgi:NADH-quinone oxidoreductase subunit N
MIAGPLLLLTLPIVMAGAAYFLLRWRTASALTAAATALVLGILVVTVAVDQPVQIVGGRRIAMGETVSVFGRELAIEQSDRVAMAILFFSSAGMFLLAWRLTDGGLLFPVGLAVLGLLGGALLIRPLVYAILLLELAAALSVFALQSEGGPPARGGLLFLTVTTLSLPAALVTIWLLDRYAMTPDETGLLTASAVLLAISSALLIGAAPFHSWVPAIAADSEPMAGAFVLTVFNVAASFIVVHLLEAYPAVSDDTAFNTMTSGMGVATCLLGAILAPAQRRIGRVIGCGVLVDNGAMLAALGMGTQQGLALVFLALMMRPLGVALAASGLSALRKRVSGDDRFESVRGLGREDPWAAVALVGGLISLAGLPITAGFAWRWALYRALAASSPASAVVLLIASLGMVVGAWKVLAILLLREHPLVGDSGQAESVARTRWQEMLPLLAPTLACFIVGLLPNPLASVALELAELYVLAVP